MHLRDRGLLTLATLPILLRATLILLAATNGASAGALLLIDDERRISRFSNLGDSTLVPPAPFAAFSDSLVEDGYNAYQVSSATARALHGEGRVDTVGCCAIDGLSFSLYRLRFEIDDPTRVSFRGELSTDGPEHQLAATYRLTNSGGNLVEGSIGADELIPGSGVGVLSFSHDLVLLPGSTYVISLLAVVADGAGIAEFTFDLTTAPSANLLSNSDFDSDTSGWFDPFPNGETVIGHASDTALDYDATPAISGSLELTTSISNGAADGPGQCVEVSPDTTYRAAGGIYRPTQDLMPQPYLQLSTFSDASCFLTTGHIPIASFLPVDIFDQWYDLEFDVTTPPGTGSIYFRLLSGNTFDPTLATVYFDSVYLPEPGRNLLIATVGAVLLSLRCLRRRAALRGLSG